MNNTLKLRYIWIDGTEGTALLRAKTKIHRGGPWESDQWTRSDLLKFLESKTMGLVPWRADGSSTEQAKPEKSDIKLVPVNIFRDPLREGGNAFLVLCEVYDYDSTDGRPHVSNTRWLASEVLQLSKHLGPCASMEQEYVFTRSGDGLYIRGDDSPLGFPWGFAANNSRLPKSQGAEYCGVGADRVFGRHIAERALDACLEAGLNITGTNPEVMRGQWEIQVGGPGVDPVEMADQIWIARYLISQVGEEFGVAASFEPKVIKSPDWNGSGNHTNFSTEKMRTEQGNAALSKGISGINKRTPYLMTTWGDGYRDRLTGKCETAKWNEFTSGIGDRTASVRIPTEDFEKSPGYIEDRRPNANCDPYKVVRAMMEVVCLGVTDKIDTMSHKLEKVWEERTGKESK